MRGWNRREFVASLGMLAARSAEDRPAPIPRAGAFRKVYDPGRGRPGGPWHMNDHAFIRGPDGLWHLFGIAWPDPGVSPAPARGFLEHATARTLLQDGWDRRDPVLELDPKLGETVMWAPHVVLDRGTYHLFVATGGPDLTRWGITRATSRDLVSWTRRPEGPLFRDGFQARDPMVFRPSNGREWVMVYTATERPDGGRHVVAYRTSPDLDHWSDRRIAFADDQEGTDFGPTESPFVVERDGTFYLFLGPRPYDRPTPDRPNFRHRGYVGTDVFASRDWRSWTIADKLAHLPAHAAEVVLDGDSWFVSSCGIGQGGLSLAPLSWDR